jgi:hypothetical protein
MVRVGEMSTAAHRFNNDLRYRDGDHPHQTALTPPYILEPVRRALGVQRNGNIDLDPCTTPENPVRAARWYSPPHDGLSLPWDAETIFVNPPYGKAREPWVARCIRAATDGSRVVLLMPAHTDTRCFQGAAGSADEVLFVRGRVKFGVLRPNRRQVAASHPSALLAWNCSLVACEHLGTRVRSFFLASDSTNTHRGVV